MANSTTGIGRNLDGLIHEASHVEAVCGKLHNLTWGKISRAMWPVLDAVPPFDEIFVDWLQITKYRHFHIPKLDPPDMPIPKKPGRTKNRQSTADTTELYVLDTSIGYELFKVRATDVTDAYATISGVRRPRKTAHRQIFTHFSDATKALAAYLQEHTRNLQKQLIVAQDRLTQVPHLSYRDLEDRSDRAI